MFEQAQAALEQNITETESTIEQGNQEPQGQSASSEPLDLEKAEKIRWEGKDYTPDQFRKMMMFQSDYTKKMQSISKEKEYISNLRYDLQAVRQNPKLAAEFMKIYPKEYHSYLDDVMPQDWKSQQQSDLGNLPPEVKEKLERFDSYIKEQEVSREEANIEKITSSLSQKYPEAIEDVVLARAQAIIDQGHTLTKETWEKLYKTSHDFMVKKMTEKQNHKFDSQKNANLRGRGIGPGGGTPGQAPRKLSFDQATEAAIQDLTGRR